MFLRVYQQVYHGEKRRKNTIFLQINIHWSLYRHLTIEKGTLYLDNFEKTNIVYPLKSLNIVKKI